MIGNQRPAKTKGFSVGDNVIDSVNEVFAVGIIIENFPDGSIEVYRDLIVVGSLYSFNIKRYYRLNASINALIIFSRENGSAETVVFFSTSSSILFRSPHCLYFLNLSSLAIPRASATRLA